LKVSLLPYIRFWALNPLLEAILGFMNLVTLIFLLLDFSGGGRGL